MKSIVVLLFISFFSNSFSQDFSRYDKIVDSLKQLKQEDNIIPYLENCIKLNPKDELALRFIGSLYIQNNQLDLAEKSLNSAIALNANCANCYKNLARMYAIKNELDKALEKIDYALKLEPLNIEFYRTRAEIKVAKNDLLSATSDINKAIELEPKNSSLYISRAKLNQLKKLNVLALRDYDKAIQISPTDAGFYYERSNYYFDQFNFEESLKDINSAILIDSLNSNLYLARGVVCANLNEIESAISNCTKAIEIDSTNSMGYYNRSLGRYSLEDMNGACEDRSKALSLFLKYSPDSELIESIKKDLADFCDCNKPSYYYQRGIAMYNLKKFKESIDIYTVGLTKFPAHSLLLNFRGNANLSSHNYRLAIKDYEESFKNMDLFKKELLASNELSNKGEGFNSPDEYIHSLEYTTYFSIAECYFYLESFDTSFIEINKGIDMLTVNDKIGVQTMFSLRGNIYITRNKFKEAIVDFNESIEMDKTYRNAYVYRAYAKMNLENDVSVNKNKIIFLNGEYGLYYAWTFPEKTKINKNDSNVLSALEDCNIALRLDPSYSYTYYLRGFASQTVGFDSCCQDFETANKLGFPVEVSILKKCGLLKR